MNKNVCFLITEHPFLDARIFKKEAKSLHSHGYQVTMIVPRKNGYLFDVDGRIFHDQFLKPTFFHDGIKIITYEQIQPESQLKNLHYNLRSGNPNRFTDALTKLGIAQQADIYHAHEFFSLYSGIGIKHALRTRGKACKLIYDSHELEPDPLVMESSNNKKLKNEMLVSMLRETDHVITVSQSIKSWYHRINSTIPVDVIYNSPPLTSNHKPGQGKEKGLTLAFEGMIDSKRGSFEKLMEIVKLSNTHLNLKVRIIGGRKKSSNKQCLRIPPQIADKVEFSGWVSYDSIPSAMQYTDIGWVDLDAEHSLNNRYAMPNKFFSYLNNGIPILANQCDDMANFIHTHDCGYIVKKRQATAADYVQALLQLHSNRKLISDMSTNARNIMETHYSWGQMKKKLVNIYTRLDS